MADRSEIREDAERALSEARVVRVMAAIEMVLRGIEEDVLVFETTEAERRAIALAAIDAMGPPTTASHSPHPSASEQEG